jgi:NADP-dependent aldehyde dehydrogenase
MPISGQLLINGNWQPGAAGSFTAINPAEGTTLNGEFSKADAQQISACVDGAREAFLSFSQTSLQQRAGFLRACARQIMELGDELLITMQAETGYPRGRGEGERGRT